MRLKELYQKAIVPKMKDKFSYANIWETPRLTKVVVNVGVGRHSKEKDFIKKVSENLAKITGQKAVLTKAKKSISAFKIREGMIVGVVVTLRGERMYDFIEKMVNVTFPRVRDFRGISDKIVDNRGNLSIGFKEHLSFPEIKADDMENVHGLEVNITSTAKTHEEGVELFTLLGFPFKKEE